MRKYEFNKTEVELLHKLVVSECETFKNHIAHAVERRDFERATRLVQSLRDYQKLFAATNVEAHNLIDTM